MLKRKESDGPVEYEMMQKKSIREVSANLDPYHSHFILVDNVQINEFGGEIEFRSSLESALRASNTVSDSRIPIVQLLMGGGRHTVEQVENSLKNDIPCVFFDETGKFSSIFSFILKKIENEPGLLVKNKLNHDFRVLIESKVMKEMKTTDLHTNINENNIADVMKRIDTIFELGKMHLLSYFQLNSNFESNDVDIAILKSLLKALKSEKNETNIFINYKEEFDLCSTWGLDPNMIHAFLLSLKALNHSDNINKENILKNCGQRKQINNDLESKLGIHSDEGTFKKKKVDLLKRYREQLQLISKSSLETVAKLVIFIFKHKDMAHLFEKNKFSKEFRSLWLKEEMSNLLDELENLFSTNAYEELTKRYREQLDLSLKWNRFDVAKEHILTYSNRERLGSLDQFMYEAINKNRTEFVKDFLENGFILKNLTTYRMILKLYNTVSNSEKIFF
jgi:hypothetical protein